MGWQPSSGARPRPDGQLQVPGGWNRIGLADDDLLAFVASLRARGVQFRNEITSGPGDQQVQMLDPDGNPVELFQPLVEREVRRRQPRSDSRIVAICRGARQALAKSTHRRLSASRALVQVY
jgi:catechol 2,3-dioxygenase-like lactoylglutathione lyase family enzyme